MLVSRLIMLLAVLIAGSSLFPLIFNGNVLLVYLLYCNKYKCYRKENVTIYRPTQQLLSEVCVLNG